MFTFSSRLQQKGAIGPTEVRALIALALEAFCINVTCKFQMTYKIIAMVYLYLIPEKLLSEKDEFPIVGSQVITRSYRRDMLASNVS